jgi:hypothetical protein
MKMYIERDRYTATCNMAMRRPIFEAVGPFAGIGIAEDMDWGWRATDMGYRLAYVPELRVSTPARRSFAELARKWDRHIAHFYAENRTRPLAGPRWLARTAAMVASPVAEVPRILGSDRLGSAADRGRALLGVTRLRFYRARQMLRLALGTDPAHMSGAWRRN